MKTFKKSLSYFFFLSQLLMVLWPGQLKADSMFGPELPRQTLQGALKSDFKHYENLTTEIQSTYGPNVLFVGIGRSPTPIIAMMKAMSGVAPSVNLPFARLNLFTEKLDEKEHIEINVTEAEMRKRFAGLLDAIIGSLGTTAPRKLVFLDCAHTGIGMINFRREFDRWNRERPADHRFDFELVALVHPTQPQVRQRLESAGIKTIVTNSKLGSNFDNRIYREMAEYDSGPINYRGYKIPERQTIEMKQTAFMDNFNRSWTDSDYYKERWAVKRKAQEMKEYEKLASFDLLVEAYRNKLRDESDPSKSKNIFARWLYRLNELRQNLMSKTITAQSCQNLFR